MMNVIQLFKGETLLLVNSLGYPLQWETGHTADVLERFTFHSHFDDPISFCIITLRGWSRRGSHQLLKLRLVNAMVRIDTQLRRQRIHLLVSVII